MDRLSAAVSMVQGDWNQLRQGAGLFVVESDMYPAMPSAMAFSARTPEKYHRT